MLYVAIFNEPFLLKPTAFSVVSKSLNASFIKLLDSGVLFPTGNEYISIFNLCCNSYLFLGAILALVGVNLLYFYKIFLTLLVIFGSLVLGLTEIQSQAEHKKSYRSWAYRCYPFSSSPNCAVERLWGFKCIFVVGCPCSLICIFYLVTDMDSFSVEKTSPSIQLIST